MNNFAYTNCPNYHSPLFDFPLPKDPFKEENHTSEFYDSLLGDNPTWGGNEWSFRHQANFIEPKGDLLRELYENCYTPPHYRYDHHHELDFNAFRSKPHLGNEFSAAYPEYPSHDVSGLNFYTPYQRADLDKDHDRLSQIWSASLAHLGDLRNDFGKDSEAIGSSLERAMNSVSMEKDKNHVFGDNADHFSSGNNGAGLFFEGFPHCNDTYAQNFAQMFNTSERQKQPVQNTSMAAETGENYRHTNCCNYGEQLKTELLQIVSSLTAQVGRLEIQVEHLTHTVQDMADKLSGENNKLSAPILDHSGKSKAVLEESEATESKSFIAAADSNQKSVSAENNKISAPILDQSGKSKAVLEESEATDSKSFIAAADSNQKSDENGSIDDSDASSASDWEII